MALTDDIMTQLGTFRGFQDFLSTTDPAASAAQNYTFKLTLNGAAFNSGNDITVTLTAGESLSSIATKIATAINNITASSVTVAKIQTDPAINTIGLIRVSSMNATSLVSAVSLSAPTAGSSLLTLLGGVGTAVKLPYILDGRKINEPKNRPAVIVFAGDRRKTLASTGLKANIEKTPFTVRCFGDTENYSQLLEGECRNLLDGKSFAGGWWHVEDEIEDKGNQNFTALGVFGHQTRWITNPRFA